MRPGFSLVELMVVLLVVSVLAYIAVPKIEIARFRMDTAIRGAMTTLVSAQRLAVKRQHDVVVAFDTANRRLLVHQDRDNDGVADSDEPVRSIVFDDGVVYGRSGAPAWGTPRPSSPSPRRTAGSRPFVSSGTGARARRGPST